MRPIALLLCGLAVACGNAPSSLEHEGPGQQSLTDSPELKDAGADAPSGPSVVFIDTATNESETSMLLGDPLDIVISGLPAGAEVTVEGCLNSFGNWGSSVVFKASSSGTVDLATSAATSGSYTGVDVGGLIWSMTALKSACTPAQPRGGLGVTATVGGKQLAKGSLQWLFETPNVTCTKVSDDGLVGLYCAPAGAKGVGGIVAFGGSEGGLSTGAAYAEYYASLGYPTLGLAYFGTGSLPKTLKNVPLEYFQTAFKWLAGQKEVDPSRLLVNGLSRGGELSLLLGATFPQVTAVVAEFPSGVLWGSTDKYGSAWTYMGAALPHISNTAGDGKPYKVTEPDGTVAYADLPYFTSALAASSAASITAATTQVQNTAGPILMIGGASDQLWGACDLAGYAVDQLVTSGHAVKYGDSLLCYPDAGHNVDVFSLDAPTTASMYYFEGKQAYAVGGTAAGIAHAARDADTQKRAFLAANLL